MTNWQAQGVRVPGVPQTLSEEQVANAVDSALQVASAATAAEVTRYLSGDIDRLSRSARTEMGGLVQGYASYLR